MTFWDWADNNTIAVVASLWIICECILGMVKAITEGDKK